jgi:hypothetical protein
VIGTPSATVPEILGNAGGTPVAGGFDVSAIESQISAATDAIAVVASDINRLETSKKAKLTAGSGISIVNNVISASGGGLQYFHETQRALYGDNPARWSCLSGYYFDYKVEDHVGINDPSEHSLIEKANDVPAIICAAITNSSGHFSNYYVGGIFFI